MSTSLVAYSADRRRREAAHGLGLDPDTLRPVARPDVPLADLIADTDLLGTRDRLAALTALAQAESASRSAAALESIAASLARLTAARTTDKVA